VIAVAPPRIVDPCGLYHVFSRGNFRQEVFLDVHHFRRFVDLLTRVVARRRWTILDWCLLPNHYHLILKLNENGLSDGMRELNGCFSRWSNLRTGRTGTGHLWKNRFKSLDVLAESHFWEVLRYVPNNPVEAGLAQRPEDWRWSGYRATIGLEHPYPFHQPGQLLRYFADEPRAAVNRYVQFVHEGLVRSGHDPWSDQEADLAAPGRAVVESRS
jgi:REP element-mobilizing transposase RayT